MALVSRRRPLTLAALFVTVAMTCYGLLVVSAPPRAHAAAGEVLILDSSVSGGMDSIEAQEVTALGLTPVVISEATWSSMTTAQFASYRAIVLGDPTCGGTAPAAPIAQPAVWGAAVKGNVIINGTDPVFHQGQGGDAVTRRSVDFAVANPAATGAYVSLSCYYESDSSVNADLLDGIRPGGFSVSSASCYNNAHIVATHPALAGLTDSMLSDWSCSVHEKFDRWPGDFAVLAIAKDLGSAFTSSDGTVGTPYVLASGSGLKTFPLSLSPLAGTGSPGTAHTVTAQLLDGATSAPVTGTTITFEVTDGPNAGVNGTCPTACITGADGTIAWTYVGGPTAGDDTIRAYLDQNSNGKADVGEPQTTAGMHWSTLVDSDGDGLPDLWETNGVTGPGGAKIDLKAMGANPRHKDLFIRVDAEKRAGLSSGAKTILKDAYATAPVTNPDKRAGIALHLISGPTLSSSTSDGLRVMGTLSNGKRVLAGPDYEAIFKRWTDSDPIQAAVFHLVYSVQWPDWHTYNAKGKVQGDVHGQSNGIPSQMVVINVCHGRHFYDHDCMGDVRMATTTMHELGHNLGLGHGGDENVNDKPNYISIMNYAYPAGIPGLPNHGVTYSNWGPETLPDLNEEKLSESAGVKATKKIPSGVKARYICPGDGPFDTVSVSLNTAVDWNCNKKTDSRRVKASINGDKVFTVLHAFNDWQHLTYTGGSIGSTVIELPPIVPTF